MDRRETAAGLNAFVFAFTSARLAGNTTVCDQIATARATGVPPSARGGFLGNNAVNKTTRRSTRSYETTRFDFFGSPLRFFCACVVPGGKYIARRDRVIYGKSRAAPRLRLNEYARTHVRTHARIRARRHARRVQIQRRRKNTIAPGYFGVPGAHPAY